MDCQTLSGLANSVGLGRHEVRAIIDANDISTKWLGNALIIEGAELARLKAIIAKVKARRKSESRAKGRSAQSA